MRALLIFFATWCTEQAGVGLLLGEQKDSSIVSVKQVVPRGSADRTNRIRVGDQVGIVFKCLCARSRACVVDGVNISLPASCSGSAPLVHQCFCHDFRLGASPCGPTCMCVSVLLGDHACLFASVFVVKRVRRDVK